MTTEEKALALVNEIEREDGLPELTPCIMRGLIMDEALCRAIEQHEAFKQEVSDALVWYFGSKEGCVSDALRDFIIPKPKPDPLVEVLKDFGGFMPDADDFRAALEARGLEIREKGQ